MLNKSILLILILLVILLACLFYFLYLHNQTDATGQVHASYSSMIQSTPEGHAAPAIVFGTIFGSISIMLFVLFLYIGIHQKKASKNKVFLWLLGLVLYLMIFILGILDYLTYLRTGSITTYLGFPTPTAWMLFGIYLFPLYFTLFYILKFKYWVLSPDSEKRFRDLVQ